MLFDIVAKILIEIPIKAIIEKETLRSVAPATKPIKGGPIKKPKKPIVETAAIATPAESFLDFPAAPYTSGTTDETPKPTRRNPIIAKIKVGKATEIISPNAVRTPLSCSVLFSPNLDVKPSAINLPVAIVLIKAVYPAPIKLGSA